MLHLRLAHWYATIILCLLFTHVYGTAQILHYVLQSYITYQYAFLQDSRLFRAVTV